MLNWDDLRFLLAIGRRGSVLGAARELKVDRATVFRRVAAAESALGTRLIHRTRSGCELTAAGRAALVTVEGIDESIVGLASRVAGQDARLGGSVRVTVPEWFAVGLFIPELPRFCAAHPEVDVELVTGNQLLSLSRREADIAMRNVRPDQKNLFVTKLGATAFALYAARAYVEAHGAPERTGWGGHRLATFDESLAFMPGYGWLAEQARAARAAFRATDNLPLLAAARAGLGVALLPCVLGDAARELVRVAPGVVAHTDVWLVVHRELRRTARVRAMLDFMVALWTTFGPALRGETAPASRR